MNLNSLELKLVFNKENKETQCDTTTRNATQETQCCVTLHKNTTRNNATQKTSSDTTQHKNTEKHCVTQQHKEFPGIENFSLFDF